MPTLSPVFGYDATWPATAGLRTISDAMERHPRTLAALVLQQLQDTGQPPTPENFARLYYEFSVKPLPRLHPDLAQLLESEPCQEFVRSLKELIDETAGVTDHLAADLDGRSRRLQESARELEASREREGILRSVAALLLQASGIQESVEAGRRELRQTQDTVHRLQQELLHANRMLGEDALTGTLNRRGLDDVLAREVARAERHQSSLCLVMADIDHFKSINDAYGHEAGDRMIVHFAKAIRSVLRQSDALARYGGEEFVIVLADAGVQAARLIAQRLRALLAQTPLAFEGQAIHATFSAGIAELKPGEKGVDLLRRADVALYAAKAAGRDCCRLAP